jgi:hypothetical protein
MTRLAAFVLVLLGLLTSGCGEAEEAAVIEDPSKLSVELEEQAKAIEERADAAVREAEALAQQELRQLSAEAVAAEQAESTAASESGSDAQTSEN